MLTEQRYQKIMDIVDSKKTVTVLRSEEHTSELQSPA